MGGVKATVYLDKVSNQVDVVGAALERAVVKLSSHLALSTLVWCQAEHALSLQPSVGNQVLRHLHEHLWHPHSWQAKQGWQQATGNKM